MKKIAIPAALIIAIAATTFAGNPPTTTAKPIKMDRQMFIERVYNYPQNPKEWKYEGDRPAIVDFWAPWCGPCLELATTLDELAAEYGNSIHIYKVNIVEETELARAFGIGSVLPMLLFIPTDQQAFFAKGALSKIAFRKIIDKMLLGEGDETQSTTPQ